MPRKLSMQPAQCSLCVRPYCTENSAGTSLTFLERIPAIATQWEHACILYMSKSQLMSLVACAPSCRVHFLHIQTRIGSRFLPGLARSAHAAKEQPYAAAAGQTREKEVEFLFKYNHLHSVRKLVAKSTTHFFPNDRSPLAVSFRVNIQATNTNENLSDGTSLVIFG